MFRITFASTPGSFDTQEPLELNTREELHALVTGVMLGRDQPIEQATGLATAVLEDVRENGETLDIQPESLGFHVEYKDGKHTPIKA